MQNRFRASLQFPERIEHRARSDPVARRGQLPLQ
jgi:hypothetical protein